MTKEFLLQLLNTASRRKDQINDLEYKLRQKENDYDDLERDKENLQRKVRDLESQVQQLEYDLRNARNTSRW